MSLRRLSLRRGWIGKDDTGRRGTRSDKDGSPPYREQMSKEWWGGSILMSPGLEKTVDAERMRDMRVTLRIKRSLAKCMVASPYAD